MKRFKKVAVGGTFDQLHRGHEALLAKAFEVGKNVVIGLTSDRFVSRLDKPHKTSSYTKRLGELNGYLAASGLLRRSEIVPLNDPVGLTLSAKGLEAIIVSQETAQIAQIINVKRQKVGLLPLDIVTVEMVQAENECPISTTRIISGEIDRNGHMLRHLG